MNRRAVKIRQEGKDWMCHGSHPVAQSTLYVTQQAAARDLA
jgi:hypothetical protein